MGVLLRDILILYNCVANVIAQQVCLVFVLRVHLLLVSGDIESNPGPTRYLCKLCSKPMRKNHRALCCDQCDQWVPVWNTPVMIVTKISGFAQFVAGIVTPLNASLLSLACCESETAEEQQQRRDSRRRRRRANTRQRTMEDTFNTYYERFVKYFFAAVIIMRGFLIVTVRPCLLKKILSKVCCYVHR